MLQILRGLALAEPQDSPLFTSLLQSVSETNDSRV